MTLLEILIVVMLVGVVVPPLTSSLSRQSAQRTRNTARDLALIYAEEGVELMLNGGYRHWYPLLRPTSPGTNDVTLTIAPTGQSSDDPFNPFVGTVGSGGANVMQLKPWSLFRREYTLASRGAPGNDKNPRLIEGTVKVWYGPTDLTDTISVPLWIANHHPSPGPRDTGNYLRGILWVPNGITLAALNSLPPAPECLTPCTTPRFLWGVAPESIAGTWRALKGSSYPIGVPTCTTLNCIAPAVGYPP